MIPEVSAPPSVDRLWQVIIALAGGASTVIAIAIGHLHMRLNGLSERFDNDREYAENRRSAAMKEIWQELRRSSEASAEWRERMASQSAALATQIANVPTRTELREMLSERQHEAHVRQWNPRNSPPGGSHD
jgi:hypothetical protein